MPNLQEIPNADLHLQTMNLYNNLHTCRCIDRCCIYSRSAFHQLSSMDEATDVFAYVVMHVSYQVSQVSHV